MYIYLIHILHIIYANLGAAWLEVPDDLLQLVGDVQLSFFE